MVCGELAIKVSMSTQATAEEATTKRCVLHSEGGDHADDYDHHEVGFGASVPEVRENC